MTLSSGIDYLMEWDSRAFLDWYLQQAPDESQPYSGGLENGGDFLRLVADMAAKGRGTDFRINSRKLCAKIEKRFKIREYAVAGTAAQGACALAKMGFATALHTTVVTKRLHALMAYPGLLVEKGGRLSPITQVRAPSTEDYAPHFIFQYKPGDQVMYHGQWIAAHNSNRLILTYDQKNMEAPVNSRYFEAVLKENSRVSSVVISGLNMIDQKETLLIRVNALLYWIGRLRAKNEETVVFLEGAAYQHPDFLPVLYEKLGGAVDILGFNEDEMQDILLANHIQCDFSAYDSLVAALRFLLQKYTPALGIVFHTKDYSLYFGKKCSFDIEAGLHLGNLMAGAKAGTGNYGDLESLGQCFGVPYSAEGLHLINYAANYGGEEAFIVAPNRCLQLPACTVGLGDTFTAGLQIGFI